MFGLIVSGFYAPAMEKKRAKDIRKASGLALIGALRFRAWRKRRIRQCSLHTRYRATLLLLRAAVVRAKPAALTHACAQTVNHLRHCAALNPADEINQKCCVSG